MPSVDNLIIEGEKINDNAASKFESGVKTIESAVHAEIRKIFANMDISGGRISPNKKTLQFLASLEKRVLDALKKGGYNAKVSDLLKKFDVIKANNIALQSAANSINIANSSLTDIQKFETQNAIDKLLKTGINKEFINPMREALYRNVSFGGSVADAEKIIEDYVVTKGNNKSKLLQYTGQVARDTISQFDGSIQAQIGQALDLKDFLYAGSLITDSRCQCRYWVEKRILLRDELIDEIETAVNKGTLGGCKCSGMIPGTNINNFASNRGGYRCRHRVIAISASKQKIDKVQIEKEIDEFPKDANLVGNDADLQHKSIRYYVENKDKLVKDYIKKFGNTANTDEARKLFEKVGYNGTNASAVHEASSALAKAATDEMIKTSKSNIVEMYAGGPGSGKTSAIGSVSKKAADEVAAIIDGTMAGYAGSIKKMDKLLSMGKSVNISYVYRDPVDAWENGVIKRMLENKAEGGRTVRMSTFLEGTEGSYKTIRKMYENQIDKLPNVNISIIDNSLGKGNTDYMSMKKFMNIKFDDALKQKLLKRTKELLDSGRITKEQYNALIL